LFLSFLFKNTLPLLDFFKIENRLALIVLKKNKNTPPLKEVFYILFRETFLESKVFRETKKFENPWFRPFLVEKDAKESLRTVMGR
jgi:hypothetical protein